MDKEAILKDTEEDPFSDILSNLQTSYPYIFGNLVN